MLVRVFDNVLSPEFLMSSENTSFDIDNVDFFMFETSLLVWNDLLQWPFRFLLRNSVVI